MKIFIFLILINLPYNTLSQSESQARKQIERTNRERARISTKETKKAIRRHWSNQTPEVRRSVRRNARRQKRSKRKSRSVRKYRKSRSRSRSRRDGNISVVTPYTPFGYGCVVPKSIL